MCHLTSSLTPMVLVKNTNTIVRFLTMLYYTHLEHLITLLIHNFLHFIWRWVRFVFNWHLLS